ncbi:heat shock 70 kDa protein 16 [Tanacetum coccineum]
MDIVVVDVVGVVVVVVETLVLFDGVVMDDFEVVVVDGAGTLVGYEHGSDVIDPFEHVKEIFIPTIFIAGHRNENPLALVPTNTQITEINLESPVEECVIGIPSYFTDLQRREYLDAANIAGLKPLKLIQDCTAIALAYGMYKTDFPKSPTNVLFVDIGHCTQVMVAAFERSQLKALSHSFDQDLGGRDFDEVLFKHFASQFKEKYNIDVYSNTRASIRLRASCDTNVEGFITREEFEILSLELLERIIVPCIKAVKDSGLSVDKIYAIELAGSGSRIPAIRRKLTSILWKEPNRTSCCSEYVARGCALQCAILSPTHNVKDYKIQDIFPYSIGFSVEDGTIETNKEITIFPKGSPFSRENMFKYPRNPPLRIQVFYINKIDFPAGVSPNVLGQTGSNPPKWIVYPETSGVEKVKVQFKVKLNQHGIFEIVSASLIEDTRKAMFSSSENILADLQVSRNYVTATTKDELREAQEKEKMLAEQDIKTEQHKDQRNTREYFLYNPYNKLADETTKGQASCENYGVFDNIFGERKKNKAPYTEPVLAEQDIKVEQTKEKRHYHGKLSLTLENSEEDENARMQATTPLITCISDYRSIADSLPLIQKEEVNNECMKAEQWLNDHLQQHSSPNKVDPVHWSSIIKYSVEAFERRCEHIMRSKPSSE